MTCQEDHVEVVTVLLGAGTAVGTADKDEITPLFMACQHGHAEVATVLLGAGAAVDKADSEGDTPLFAACHQGHTQVVTVLLGAGAAVEKADNDGRTPLFVACQEGHVECTQLLSSYGASRSLSIGGQTISAEEVASDLNHHDIIAWLVSSRQWSTPLHHLTILTAARARAPSSVRVPTCAPPPLRAARRRSSSARAKHAVGAAPDDSLAGLVRPRSHGARRHMSFPPHSSLFFAAARVHVVGMLMLGHRLSREPRYETVAQAMCSSTCGWTG